MFDRMKMGSSYGFDAGSWLLPTLRRELTCSILSGDLIHPDQSQGLELLSHHLQTVKSFRAVETAQLYCIYLNNLTDNMVRTVHADLLEHEAYTGFIPVNYNSRMKDWLSAVLSSTYLKAKDRMLCPHEDDVPNDENNNVPGWQVEEAGYQCLSLQGIYFNLFLRYKIERAVYPGFETDTEFSLRAISDLPVPLTRLSVAVDEEKLSYLRSEKAGSMAIAGIEQLTTAQLAEMISAKFSHNYIYNLRFHEEHNVSLFNIMLEIAVAGRLTPVRLMASMAYHSDQNVLKLVTLF